MQYRVFAVSARGNDPQNDDLAMTRSLGEALRPLDIVLHDHLILAGNQVYSITCGRTVPFAPETRALF